MIRGRPQFTDLKIQMETTVLLILKMKNLTNALPVNPTLAAPEILKGRFSQHSKISTS